MKMDARESDIESLPRPVRVGAAVLLTALAGFLAGQVWISIIHFPEDFGAAVLGIPVDEGASLGRLWGLAEFVPVLALAWLVHTRRRFRLLLVAVAYASYLAAAVIFEVAVGRTLGVATILPVLVVAVVLALVQVTSILLRDPRWLVAMTAGFGIVGLVRGVPGIAMASWLLLACVGACAPRRPSTRAGLLWGLGAGILAVAFSAVLPTAG